MATLYITEYNNMGDVSPSLVLEPATRVQKVAFGEVSAVLHPDTRVVCLYSDLPCKVRFFAGTPDPDALKEHASPMQEHYEVQRLIHMNSQQRVAVFDMDD